jgi:hypothetical protein
MAARAMPVRHATVPQTVQAVHVQVTTIFSGARPQVLEIAHLVVQVHDHIHILQDTARGAPPAVQVVVVVETVTQPKPSFAPVVNT